MSEKIGPRTVNVAASQPDSDVVIADFINKGKNGDALSHGYHVNVELSEAELELTGEEFATAVREALKRVLYSGEKVVLYRNTLVEADSTDLEVLGFRLDAKDIEQLEVKNKWWIAA